MTERKTINIDILGIGRISKGAFNFLIISVLVVVFLILSFLFGTISLMIPGLTEMSMDIIKGHTGRFVVYLVLSLISFFVVISIFKGTGKFFSCFLTLFIITSIWGYTIDPAVSRGYNVYVYTNDGGRYYVKNAKLWRMRERIEGFDLHSDRTKYYICLGDVAWIYIGRSITARSEKFLFWDVKTSKKTTACTVYFNKEKKLEGYVKLLSGSEVMLEGKNRSGGNVMINIKDIYNITFPGWKPENPKEFQ